MALLSDRFKENVWDLLPIFGIILVASVPVVGVILLTWPADVHQQQCLEACHPKRSTLIERKCHCASPEGWYTEPQGDPEP